MLNSVGRDVFRADALARTTRPALRRLLLGALRWLLTVCVVAAPGSASAFSFEEHYRLGQDAYQHACHLLHTNLSKLGSLNPKDADGRAQRLEMACPGRAPLRDDLARVFGQAVAISGDHVGTPEELGSVEGLRASLNLVNYAKLGLENAPHFHPTGPQQWSEYRNKALKIAYATATPLEARARFEEMLRNLAFGEHFLQDAFAAGHMGFNRPSSAPVAAMLYHDLYSRAGRVVASSSQAAGERDYWVTYGDYHLCDEHEQGQPKRCEASSFLSQFEFAVCMCSKPCPKHTTHGHADAHLRVHAAATRAVLEVLFAFVTKQPGFDVAIAEWAPKSDLGAPDKATLGKFKGRPSSVPDEHRQGDVALVIALLQEPVATQLPTSYCLDNSAKSKGCHVEDHECPKELPDQREHVPLNAVPKRSYVLFAPVIEMRWGTGLVGNVDYGFWMPGPRVPGLALRPVGGVCDSSAIS